MPKHKFETIEALIEELEPHKRYIILLDKHFIDDYGRDELQRAFEQHNHEHGSVIVLGDGDPSDLTYLQEADNWGYATIKLKDFAFRIVWRLPDYSEVALKDFNVSTNSWPKEMIERFVQKVEEAFVSIKAKQGENSETQPR